MSLDSLDFLRMYGVATISRLLKVIGLFCKRALEKRLHSAKETCDSKEPTNRTRPIGLSRIIYACVCVCVC